MERVSIQEASRRLRISTASVRECIRGGELKASRETGPDGRRGGWLVELPSEDWVSAATTAELNRDFSPWWWANPERHGEIHYVASLAASSWEETVPQFLCGLTGDNIWAAPHLPEESLCLECRMRAIERGLPYANPAGE